MAKNREYERALQVAVPITDAPGATALSGDPVLCGQLPGVALVDADDTVANDGEATVQFDGAFRLAVKGVTGAGNSAVSPGDIIYYDGGELNKDVTNGVRFGYALGAVDSAGTATIVVKIGY